MSSSSPALLRQINLSGAIALVISNTVGVGILTTSGYLARDLGDPLLFLGIWVVGGILALIGALCYGELGINFPASGGEYVFLTQAYGPSFGFMTGWTSFLAGFAAPVAAAALAFADYAGTFFPAFQQSNQYWQWGSGMFSIRIGGAQILASAAIGVLTLSNLFGVQRASNIQKILTGIKLTVLGLFILLALLVGSGNWANFSLPTLRDSSVPLAAQFAISFYFVYVSFSGWNAATYIAEEIRDPLVNLPKALLVGTIVVTILYLALNAVFLYAAPLGVMKGVVAVGALASSRLFGSQMAGFFSALMALALLAAVNAMSTVGPRVAYAMARNGAFLPVAAQVDPQWRTPVPAILMQSVVSMAMTLTTLPSLFFFIGFTLNFSSLMSVFALFRFRKRTGWRKIAAVSFAWPLLPVTFLAISAWMTLFGFTLEPKISLTACLIIGSGSLYFHYKMKKRKEFSNWDASSTAN